MAQTRPPATKPATAPTLPDKPRYENPKNREEKLVNLLDYLERDYIKKTAAPFWVSRAMGVISLARSPRPTALPRLLELCEKDKHDVVRLLAWQAVLARAESLDAASHQRWIAATLTMAEKNAFQGALRPPLLDALATSVPTQRHRKVWQKVFDEANAWESQDISTLDALGRSLATWKSPVLAQSMIKLLMDVNAGIRAEYVLRASGSPVMIAHDRMKPEVFNPLSPTRSHSASDTLFKAVQTEQSQWLNKEKWKEITKLEESPWTKLQPAFVPAPLPLDSIDPSDPSWLADLELGRADLDAYEAIFAVDSTGSMGDVLAWLRRDVSRVMSALSMLCKEQPRLGFVFYRDSGQGDPFVTKTVPLTLKVPELQAALAGMTAEGGGDIPEAVKEALTDAIEKPRWSNSKRTGKIVILIGDAPPKPGTEEACKELAKKAKEKGLKFYAVKVTNATARNDLAVFSEIAELAGGAAIEANFAPVSAIRFLDDKGNVVSIQTIARPEAQLIVAGSSSETPPGEKILTQVLTESINPQYADRVQPLAQTLLAHVQPHADLEKRLPFPANTPPLELGKAKIQGK